MTKTELIIIQLDGINLNNTSIGHLSQTERKYNSNLSFSTPNKCLQLMKYFLILEKAVCERYLIEHLVDSWRTDVRDRSSYVIRSWM